MKNKKLYVETISKHSQDEAMESLKKFECFEKLMVMQENITRWTEEHAPICAFTVMK